MIFSFIIDLMPFLLFVLLLPLETISILYYFFFIGPSKLQKFALKQKNEENCFPYPRWITYPSERIQCNPKKIIQLQIEMHSDEISIVYNFKRFFFESHVAFYYNMYTRIARQRLKFKFLSYSFG